MKREPSSRSSDHSDLGNRTIRLLLSPLAFATFALATLALIAIAALTGSCASSAGTGTSAPRVTIVAIDGSNSAQRALAKVVGGRYKLVSAKKYSKAARKLDADSDRSKDVRKVARNLDIDAVVMGELVKKGRKKYELRLVLRAGHSGKEFDSLNVTLKSKKLGKKALRKIRKKLYAALKVVNSWERQKDLSRERERRDEEKRAEREEDRRSRKKSKKRDRRRDRRDVTTVRNDDGQAIDDEDPF